MAEAHRHPDVASPRDVSAPQLLDKFDTVANDYLIAQGSRIRELEDAIRDESTAMLKLLRDQVCAQTNPQKSGLEIVINELFERQEVRKGLVEWLPKEESRIQARAFVDHFRDDIMEGEGNNARTTLNNLLPLYMTALNVSEFLQKFGNKVPGSSPGGKKRDPQRKLLGSLVHEMRTYLEAILMAYGDAVDMYEEDVDLKETTKRLRTALYVCLNIGNVASHNRGKLSYCQRLEFCGAVGAMAETLPIVFKAYQDIKTAQTTKRAGSAKILDGNGFMPSGNQVETLSKPLPFRIRLPHEMETKTGAEFGFNIMDASTIRSLDAIRPQPNIQIELQPVFDSSSNIVAYYRHYLLECSDKIQAKYEASLKRMNLVPKARLCAKASCSGVSCPESHTTNEALSYNPLVMTLACPAPKDHWNDQVHEKKLCLFNHGEYRGAGEFRFYKKMLCGYRAECTNENCFRSHSVAEICWFNPVFRTKDCPYGKSCTRKHNCNSFHREYHTTKRLSRDELIDSKERMLFFERTLKALTWDVNSLPVESRLTDSSCTVPRLVQYYIRFIQSMSSADQDQYTRVLKHMQKVPKARMCMEGEHCNRQIDGDDNLCDESHDIAEALSFNPLAMVLACPTPKVKRDDFIHENGLCLFYHGEGGVSKEFLKVKRLLCENLDSCDDGKCMKSHSIVEACWFYPTFRIKKCPQGDLCKRMQSCPLFHSEYHEQRDSDMNDTVGTEEPVLFIERSYLQLKVPLQVACSDTASYDALDDSMMFDVIDLVEEQQTQQKLEKEAEEQAQK
ncbi:hypothetical protein P3T76_006105 [Phytophthora citrophthora]|uniref:Uncharacterized protein n=1 Tax=Phytophthora citrophthora TaxID=4793 RepID=A0AAD9LNN2_9STRA|nr:hypothetical protein P3T76_006105 [Phytophthora citrophthora]